MTDEEILALIRNTGQQEEGFRHLVLKYQQRLYGVIRARVITHEDTDDILQNTFLKVFRNVASFESRSGLFTWMYRIACNEANDLLRARNRTKTEELPKEHSGTAEAYMNTDKLNDDLEMIVQKLPERQQMVFRMRYFDEMSYREIAELLQLTEGALKASFHHAVRKIEEEIRSRQII